MQIYEIKHHYIKRFVASEPTQESESNTPLTLEVREFHNY